MKRLLWLVFLAWSPAAADAAVVHLTDGGTLQGTVLSSTANGVQLATPTGTVRIPADKVAGIDYSDPAPAPAAPPVRVVRTRRLWRVAEPSFEEARQELSLDLGGSVPLSDIDFSAVNFGGVNGGRARNGDSGLLAGFQYFYYLDPRLALGFDFHYLGRSWSSTQNLVPNTETNVAGDSEVFLGALKYRLIPDGPVRPYVLGGLGVHRTSLIVDSTPDPGACWIPGCTTETRRLVDDGSWGLASSARFGLEFPAFPPSFFAFELGWTGLFNGRYNATPAGQALGLSSVSGPLNIFTVAGRWGWRF